MRQTSAKPPKGAPTPIKEEIFSFGSGRLYADNDEYASKDLPFDILTIAFESGRGFEGGDRWAITVKAKDRDPEVMTLGANPKRDEQLQAAQAYLDRVGPITNVRLRRSGNAYYFANAEP
jgi:hypothetical protein